MGDEGPSLPSNYVTILHLKERWLKQQQQQQSPPKSNPNPHESDSQSTLKPKDDSASKIPNESVRPKTNRHRGINQLKPETSVHDSASKTPNQSVPRGRNHHRIVNQPKPEVTVHDSASKTLIQVADNHPTVEKQEEQNTDDSNSKRSTTKISPRGRNSRFVTDQIPTPPSESEPVQEKKQHRYKGGHRNRNRNREVRERKDETTPLAQKVVEDSLHDDSGVEGVIEAVKEISVTNVRQRTERRWDSGRFNGGSRNGAPFGVKKGQTTAVWVRKGESAPN